MSKVTYILGAGASYGERGNKGVNFIKRGVPVVNEMVQGIGAVIADLLSRPRSEKIDAIVSNMLEMQRKC